MNIFIGFWKGASRKREVGTMGKRKEELIEQGLSEMRKHKQGVLERGRAPPHLREARGKEGRMGEDMSVCRSSWGENSNQLFCFLFEAGA